MGTNRNEFDFYDFFHLFMDSFVTNLRECLHEWLLLLLEDKDKDTCMIII